MMIFRHKNFSILKTIKRRFGGEVERLRELYQNKGHQHANINPLEPPKSGNSLFHNVKMNDSVTIGYKQATNSADLNHLFTQIYCSSCGFEISHLSSQDEIKFLTNQIESFMTMELAMGTKREMARLLMETEVFDLFMQKRFSQVKRYGLEGLESTSTVLDFILKTSVGGINKAYFYINMHMYLVDHVVVTMPHRGRLNLMTLLMNYPPEAIFHKLAGNSELPDNLKGSADVLSHLSLQKRIEIAGNENGIITLLPNPSHLEAGNSVGLGAVYAYQKYEKLEEKCLLSLQFHGDAAFSAQGIVAECLQLSGLPNFSVKGTIHVICNNQLGFTTSPKYGRTSKYASDPAKSIDAPIFHVNADDPEAVAKVACIAVEYQKTYNKDVVIDLIGWRKMGHNELDEPAFTQPKMYENIRNRPSIAKKYAEKVLEKAEISEIEVKALEKLEAAIRKVKDFKPELIPIQKDWKGPKDLETGVDTEILKSVAIESVKIPENFAIHPRLQKHHVDHRLNQLKDDKIDWATAEAMSFGSLLREGFNVRLSGQDVARGTFSHRHLRFHDQNTGDEYEPFSDQVPRDHKLELATSNLSEFGVLGFEYGLSIVTGDKTLPIWEAQFGDFFNGAQVIFDAFLSSGEEKWGLSSNLTVLLPHGYDGAGPEHSSARIERFLQNCDENGGNWRIAQPTTPANYFHLLRGQVKTDKPKPLIIISPKTLLKSPMALSPLSDFTKSFQPILIDHMDMDKKKKTKKKAKSILFVSGKFYYDIKKDFPNTFDTIVRLEQLNPLPIDQLKSLNIENYQKIIWCQEEPKNQGSFPVLVPKLKENVFKGREVEFVGRKASAAPATGISKRHREEVDEIFHQLRAF